jgi:rSAM/selenodomain-associated transferase 2
MRISVIVPVLNEQQILEGFLRHVREAVPECEIVVVDGGSTDGSIEIGGQFSDLFVSSEKGRALQMNTGAAVATGDVFWFVHADSTLPCSAPAAIRIALSASDVIGGCFRLRIDSPRPIYRIRDFIGNALVDMTGVALGDRGLFCRRDAFKSIGGYPLVPILEDAEFCRALKEHGQLVQLRPCIGTSPRRYEALGAPGTMLFYALVMLLYCAGVSIPALHRFVGVYMKWRTAAR